MTEGGAVMAKRHPRRRTVLVLSFVLLSTSALAANWDRPTGLDSWINFDLCDLNTGYHDAWHSNNDHDIAPTVITPTHAHSCATIEVRVNDSFYGQLAKIAWWECHDSGGSFCISGHVHINLDKVGSYTAAQKLALMCQEVGHSVDLKHAMSGNSCMVQAINVNRQHLVQHDIDILNAEYS